jgi:hypothetical protein
LDSEIRAKEAVAMRYLVAACVVCLSLPTGCSNNASYWYRFDKTLDEAMEDCEECYSQATKRMLQGDMRSERFGMDAGQWRAGTRRDVGASRGFMGLDSYEMQGRLSSCMRSRGYSRVREDTLGPGVYTRHGFLGTTSYCVAGR